MVKCECDVLECKCDVIECETDVITAISSDSRPSKLEMLDINNCFLTFKCDRQFITSHIKIRQIQIRSTQNISHKLSKHKMQYFFPKLSRNHALL